MLQTLGQWARMLRPSPHPKSLLSRSVQQHLNLLSLCDVQRKLFLAWRQSPKPRPNAKELKEALAFVHRIDKYMFPKHAPKQLIVDACASHGLVGLLLVIFRRTQSVVLLDPFRPESFNNMLHAWAALIPEDACITYDERCRL